MAAPPQAPPSLDRTVRWLGYSLEAMLTMPEIGAPVLFKMFYEQRHLHV
ncbi:MAG: hypothetical protein QM706_00535 [Nitrospira sp.]